ncbi:hypothetical protein GCM10009544_03350 [Streptomyces stramineus]|uniref:Uncharacterized protein n=1 Tax=Streptomyces stramineus TaxID=173861 RepID=A0ABN0ZD16_9ACTN
MGTVEALGACSSRLGGAGLRWVVLLVTDKPAASRGEPEHIERLRDRVSEVEQTLVRGCLVTVATGPYAAAPGPVQPTDPATGRRNSRIR